ncbi:MAG TPA: hypothetical protein VNV63_05215 [Nitrospiria bacterium]|jgi:hypothetical protein|nr:hypothetical protein [Nitrospiria bacterium]
MNKTEVQDGKNSLDQLEDQGKKRQDSLYLSPKHRDRLIKRLATCGLPVREIVLLSGASGRTVARTLQRLGISRKKYELPQYPSPRKRHAKSLETILTQYYGIPFDELQLDSLHQLARRNGISLKKLFDLIRQHVSPSRWAIRTCLNCNQPSLTSSPADRYCSLCRRKVKKAREGLEEGTIYE